jgi:hypothetical protein
MAVESAREVEHPSKIELSPSVALLAQAVQMLRLVIGAGPSLSRRLRSSAMAPDGNIAKYLVDLHDARATFNFCGGMLFQLVLSESLRTHLAGLATGDASQPVVFEAGAKKMALVPGYSRSSVVDNVRFFHGREVRKVTNAAGGMGFALHLSLANAGDPEDWTPQEASDYDGWGHDQGRPWRNGEKLESEGFKTYREKFGPAAYGLHHRFYLHLDPQNRLWLSAEDGCEGTPAPSRG